MSRDINTMLDYEASRRPEVAHLLSNILILSEDEIQNAPVLKWIKLAVIARKKLASDAKFMESTRQKMKIVDGFSPDPVGEIRRWLGSDTFLNVDRGGSIEIKSHRLLWLPDTGGIWLDTVFSNLIDKRIKTTSNCVRMSKHLEYIAMYKAELARNYHFNGLQYEQPQSAGNGLFDNEVRFFRPLEPGR